MIGLLCFALAVLASPFKSKIRLEAENAMLRHQLIVLRRRLHGRVRFTNHDRWFLIQLYRWFPSILRVLTIIRPETLVRLHRAGFRCYLRWKSRRGRAATDRDGAARADPANEPGEPVLGRATQPRRTAQARVRDRAVERRQVHGQATRATQPGMAGLSAKPRSRHCRHGSVRGPDHWLQTTLRLRDCWGSSQRSPLDQRHKQPDGGVDRTPDHRGFSLERCSAPHDP